MKCILSILALVFAVEAHAQPSPINRRAMVISGLASSAFTPRSIPTLALWWVSSDLATNTGINQWTDRVQNVSFYQGVSGRQPTNKLTFGVAFQSGKILTNATGYDFNATNDDIVLVYNRYSDTPTFQDFVVNTSESGIVGQTPSGTFLLGWRNVAGANIYRPPLNAHQDFIGASIAGNKMNTYTNNVLVISSDLGANAHFALTEVGNDNSFLSSDWCSAYISEIQVYTNYHLTSGDRSNIHTDLTNRWNFSP